MIARRISRQGWKSTMSSLYQPRIAALPSSLSDCSKPAGVTRAATGSLGSSPARPSRRFSQSKSAASSDCSRMAMTSRALRQLRRREPPGERLVVVGDGGPRRDRRRVAAAHGDGELVGRGEGGERFGLTERPRDVVARPAGAQAAVEGADIARERLAHGEEHRLARRDVAKPRAVLVQRDAGPADDRLLDRRAAGLADCRKCSAKDSPWLG